MYAKTINNEQAKNFNINTNYSSSKNVSKENIKQDLSPLIKNN